MTIEVILAITVYLLILTPGMGILHRYFDDALPAIMIISTLVLATVCVCLSNILVPDNKPLWFILSVLATTTMSVRLVKLSYSLITPVLIVQTIAIFFIIGHAI